MDWREIIIQTTVDGADIAAQVLYEAGAQGVAVEDGIFTPSAEDDYVDESLQMVNETGEARVIAYFNEDAYLADKLALIRQRLADLKEMDLGVDLGVLTISMNQVKETDWAENWKKYYKPFRAGKNIVVKPTWETYEAQPGDIVIALDPGMAFGTGTHETTRMCIEYIEQYINKGDTVIDVGCGSGILAIAAAKLGASHASAVDRDPVSVKTAKENIAQNACGDVTEAYISDLLQSVPPKKADMIVANIIADIIIRLNANVSEYLSDGGVYIVSGIIASRQEEVEASLAASGFDILGVKEMGEWRATACKKP
jgi:ribosomal protein L11 methyltransferase